MSRLEELLDYGESKVERMREVADGGPSRSVQQAQKLADRRAEEAEAQRRAQEDSVLDQQEAAEARGQAALSDGRVIDVKVLKRRIEEKELDVLDVPNAVELGLISKEDWTKGHKERAKATEQTPEPEAAEEAPADA